jgi:hypothetical protein
MSRTLGRVHIEVALVQQNWVVCVFNVDVAVGDVVDASVADILSSPRLEASTILLLSVWLLRCIRGQLCLPDHLAV